MERAAGSSLRSSQILAGVNAFHYVLKGSSYMKVRLEGDRLILEPVKEVSIS